MGSRQIVIGQLNRSQRTAGGCSHILVILDLSLSTYRHFTLPLSMKSQNLKRSINEANFPKDEERKEKNKKQKVVVSTFPASDRIPIPSNVVERICSISGFQLHKDIANVYIAFASDEEIHSALDVPALLLPKGLLRQDTPALSGKALRNW